jgi:nicotinamidase-related amidase
MKALLIIDMQIGLFTPSTPRFDAHGVISRINALSEKFRELGWPVIFIQHDGTSQDYLYPNTPDWEILPSLIQKSSDIVVGKTANDAFYNSNLQETLEAKGITELVITGCATDFCVDTTIRSALGRNYKITVIEDGHTTGNRPHLDAQTVIMHHNWIWSELSPTAHRLKVKPFDEVIVEI